MSSKDVGKNAAQLQEVLKVRWSGLGYYDLFCNTLSEYKPGSFVMLFTNNSDGGYSYVRSSLVFDDAHDILAFLRYALIPHLLSDYICGAVEVEILDAESYLGSLEPETADKILQLLSMIDKCFLEKSITKDRIEIIRNNFNSTFKDGYFDKIDIHAWGKLDDVLKSSYLEDAYTGEIKGFNFCCDESKESKKKYKHLIELMRKKKFDYTNPEHLSEAVQVLEFLDTFS